MKSNKPKSLVKANTSPTVVPIKNFISGARGEVFRIPIQLKTSKIGSEQTTLNQGSEKPAIKIMELRTRGHKIFFFSIPAETTKKANSTQSMVELWDTGLARYPAPIVFSPGNNPKSRTANTAPDHLPNNERIKTAVNKALNTNIIQPRPIMVYPVAPKEQ